MLLKLVLTLNDKITFNATQQFEWLLHFMSTLFNFMWMLTYFRFDQKWTAYNLAKFLRKGWSRIPQGIRVLYLWHIYIYTRYFCCGEYNTTVAQNHTSKTFDLSNESKKVLSDIVFALYSRAQNVKKVFCFFCVFI